MEVDMVRRQQPQRGQRQSMVVEAKGKRGMHSRQFQRSRSMPPLPKVEDDGNPKFVIFICTSNVYLWYPLSIITGGTTTKIMVGAKDNFLGKYIYEDTIARNFAPVIYKLPGQDELKTVVDKVKDFFGDAASGAKESFGKVTALSSTEAEKSGSKSAI